MHIVNRKEVELMMANILKTTNSINSANYHFDKLLSACAWFSLSSLRIS